MGHRLSLRDGEFSIVSITPLSKGVIGPFAWTLLLAGAVVALSYQWHVVHRYEPVALAVFAGPPGLLTLTRARKWRSQRIIVTSQRLLVFTGVSARRRASIEWDDVVSTQIEQRWWQRPVHHGLVSVDTRVGSMVVGRVHHPEALVRVIDRQWKQPRDTHLATLEEGERLRNELANGLLSDEEYDERWRHLFGPDGPRG